MKDLFTLTKTGNTYIIKARETEPFLLYWSKAPQGFSDDFELGCFQDLAEIPDPCPGEKCYFHIMQGPVYWAGPQDS